MIDIRSAVRDAHEAGGTVIYLPLGPGAASGVSAALRHLEEHHVCLLFMRRLCCLGIEYDGRKATYELEQTSAAERSLLIRGRASGSSERRRFLVQQQEVQLTTGPGTLSLAFSVRQKPGADGKEEELQDVVSDEKGSGEEVREMQEAVYCGLPVRRVGFCFAINGPFDLVASRADVHEGSVANRLLCEGAACVALEGGGLREPGHCLLRPAAGSAAAEASLLVPAELLLKACNKQFAANAQAGQVSGFSPSRALGLEELGLEHWLQILKFRDSEWPEGLTGAFAADLGFFRVLFVYFGELVHTAEEP
ncbi:unnamed protein product, partial [Polarella glacialis]